MPIESFGVAGQVFVPLVIFDALGTAVTTILSPGTLFLLIAGTCIGLIIGIIPGMGGTITLALLIPLTFGMDAAGAFVLLAAAHGGVNQGGAITSILINTPGSAPNAATLLDGFPMARNGEGGRAISAAAVASGLGALVGLSILVLSIPILIQIILAFGPPEIFWLAVWGLSALAFVVGDDVKAGLISAGIGVLFTMFGPEPISAGYRWTFDQSYLLSGFDVVAAVIGLFAVAEMINLVSRGETIATKEALDVGGGRIQGIKDVYVNKWLFFRSAVIGFVIGTIPGIGGVTANFIAYMQASMTEKNNETFGKGDVRGVIASEASNDAKSGGAYIPTLGFGVPGSASMAVLFGAFILHGIQPGPLLLQDHLDIVAIIIVAAVLSNLIASTIAITIADWLTFVTRLDVRSLAPIIIGISFIAAFALNHDLFDIFTALLFAVLGYFMIYVGMPRIPLIIGMILGVLVEKNFFRSMQISGWDPVILFDSVISLVLIGLIIVTMFLPVVQRYVSLVSLLQGGGDSD